MRPWLSIGALAAGTLAVIELSCGRSDLNPPPDVCSPGSTRLAGDPSGRLGCNQLPPPPSGGGGAHGTTYGPLILDARARG